MASNIPVIVQGNSFSLAIPLQIYYINGDQMDLQDYTPDPTDEISIQLKGERRQYTYTPTVDGNICNIDLSGNELAGNYSVVVSVVKASGQRLRSFRTDQFFIVESSDDLTPADIIEGLEENVIYLNSSIFVAGEDGRGIESITKTSTSGLVDTYTITYTDNTTSTFQVTNGANGQAGAQGADGVGITSIEKTATVGLVDTYTITLSNGQTSTFDVTNGKDGVDLGLATIVNNLTEGGEESALSAEMGKTLGTLLEIQEDAFTQTLAYNVWPAPSTEPIMVSGKTYQIHIKADKPLGQTKWELWVLKSTTDTSANRQKIATFTTEDLSIERVVQYSVPDGVNIYGIGTRYTSGVQDTTAMITYTIPYGTYNVGIVKDVEDDVADLSTIVQGHGNALGYGKIVVLDVSVHRNPLAGSNYRWVYKQPSVLMIAGKTYNITVKSTTTFTPSTLGLAFFKADGTTFTGNQYQFHDVDLVLGQTLSITPSVDVYGVRGAYMVLGESADYLGDLQYTIVLQEIGSQSFYDFEHDILSLNGQVKVAGMNGFEPYFDQGCAKNDSYIIGEKPIGLIVMGQSQADGRIPNADFPATATIDTPNDLTLYKQLPHCMFMQGSTGATYDDASKTFASRNNNAKWSFDDIVYNAVNQALGGNTDFFVLKQTKGACGILVNEADGGFSAEINQLAEIGKNSQLYHLKGLHKSALSQNANISYRCVLWNEGGAESSVVEAGQYYNALCQIIYWIRGLIGDPNLPFIVVTSPTNSPSFNQIVKDDQLRVATDINNCYAVVLGDVNDYIDGLHYGVQTSEYIASEMYKIMRQNYMLAPMILPI